MSGPLAAVVLSGVTTLLGSYYCTPWLPRAVADYYQQPLILGLLLFGGVWALTVGPYVVAFALLYRRLARRPRILLPLLGGMAWAGMELARTRLFIGDPFGLFGYSQVEQLWLVQVADITGVYGISAVLAAANIVIVELLLARHAASDAAQRAAVGGLLTVAATVAIVAAYGQLRLRQLTSVAEASGTVVIAQGNLDLGAQWKREFYGTNLDAYMRLTANALRDHPAALVVWPESAMTFLIETEPSYRAALASLLDHYGSDLIAGGPRLGATPEQHFNSAFLLGPDGRLRAVEQRRYLIRASTSGPSAIITPTGDIAVHSAPGHAVTVRGTIEPHSDLTFYARFGDAFGLLCVLVPLLVLARDDIRQRRVGFKRSAG